MKTKAALLLLILTILILSACAARRAVVGETAACAGAGEGTTLLADEDAGYCLLYPDIFTQAAAENSQLLVVDSVLNHTEPRLEITVEDAAGRSAADLADAYLAIYSLPSGELRRSTVTLDGEEAVVLDQLPGQELSRVVFAVHDGRAYRLTFTHADPSLGETFKTMENLYNVVVDSFRFTDGA